MRNSPNTGRILPMRTEGTHHFVERAYRETGAFQWVRETFMNAIEAGATRIEYGIDWQAVESQHVYRRVIADDGRGMSSEELVEFFNTFGGSGKPIGGVHENFGIGAKTSLLPWNRYGLVVISWKDGEPSMIWVTQDLETHQYGLKLEVVEDPSTGEESLDEVYAPYDDEVHGCNWAALKPSWLKENGTVIVLLGNGTSENTIEGDPGRQESDLKGIASYLNRRIWQIPPSVSVRVLEFHASEHGRWPRSEAESNAGNGANVVASQWRNIEGAEHFIRYDTKSFGRGTLAGSGSVALGERTVVDWYLWEGDRPRVGSYAAESGYIAALYKNELYNIQNHHATYRSFGISESNVRKNVWLIVRPAPLDETGQRYGVYPRQDRNGLLLLGGPNAGQELPFSDWGAAFTDNMPEKILEAIRNARAGRSGSIEDLTWRDRLAERFGSRWRLSKLRQRLSGVLRMTAEQSGGTPAKKVGVRRRNGEKSPGGSGGTRGQRVLGVKTGSIPAEHAKVGGGIPHYRLVRAQELSDGMIAAWQPNDPEHPEGVVLINVEHPVLQSQIEHWQSQYADHFAEEIAADVLKIYGEIAVAKVAHSQHLNGVLPSKVINDELRSDGALTMALLGLIAEEAVIAPRLGGKFKKQRVS